MNKPNRTHTPQTKTKKSSKPVKTVAAESAATAQRCYERLAQELKTHVKEDASRLDAFEASGAIQRKLEALKNHPEVQQAIAIQIKAKVISGDLMPKIGDLSWALVHASYMYNSLNNLSDEVKVGTKLQSQAKATRARMVKVVRYHLEDEADVAKTLEQIANGKGYQATAQALWTLAHLYREHGDVLAQDKRLYRAEDADAAIELGNLFVKALGSLKNQELEFWRVQVGRIWSLLNQHYDQLQDVLRLCLGREREAELVPSLTILVRGRVRRTKKGRSQLPTPAPIPDDVPEVDPEVPTDPQ